MGGRITPVSVLSVINTILEGVAAVIGFVATKAVNISMHFATKKILKNQ